MLIREFERALNPWEMLKEVEREFDRLHREFDNLFSHFGEVREAVYPKTNLYSDTDKAVVIAELPGINPDELEITVHENTLTIKGERKAEELKEGHRYHLKERYEGSFQRNIRLPFRANLDGVKASYKNGLLKIEVPRAEEDKPKKIAIEKA